MNFILHKLATSVLRLFNLSGYWIVIIRAAVCGYINCIVKPAQLNAEYTFENPSNPSYTVACIIFLFLSHPNKSRDPPKPEWVI